MAAMLSLHRKKQVGKDYDQIIKLLSNYRIQKLRWRKDILLPQVLQDPTRKSTKTVKLSIFHLGLF